MSSFDYARPSGIWANEMVPGAGDYYRWDLTQSKMVNGDLGGTSSPSQPIILGGAGGSFATPGLAVGGLRTQTGGRLILGQHDVIALSPRTRKITMALLPVTPYSLFTVNAQAQFTSPGGNGFTFGPDAYFQKSPAGFPGCGLFLANVGQPIAIPIPKSYLHTVGPYSPFDGQLAAVTLNFTVLAKPGGVTPMIATPMLRFFNSRGPADTTTLPVAVSQLRARGQFASTVFWSPSTALATVGQYYTPYSFTSAAFSSYYFKLTASTGAGLTGTSFPAWNTTPGAITVDGNLTWTCIGGNGSLPISGASGQIDPAILYNGGAPQSLTLNLDTSYPLGQGLDTSSDYFMVGLAPPQDSTGTAPFNTIPIVYHSIQFYFVGITTLTGRD